MPRTVKVALAFVTLMSVAYVLVSPDLNEMDSILRTPHLGKTSTAVAHASVGQLPVSNTHLCCFAAASAFLHRYKPLLSDLTCTRLC
jgi:hypothetical protein